MSKASGSIASTRTRPHSSLPRASGWRESIRCGCSAPPTPPGRFEAGTPHIVGVVGLHAAIDYVESIGLDRIHAHETALVAATRERLGRINSVRLFGPDDAAGIVSFAVEGVHPHDVATILDEGNVAIRAGHHCAQPLMDTLGVPATARASFGVYNSLADVEALAAGVERVTRIFG